MQDSADKQTVDLFQASRRRGRPVTGQAMTNAERQRLYRQNLKSRNVTKNDDKKLTFYERGELDRLFELTTSLYAESALVRVQCEQAIAEKDEELRSFRELYYQLDIDYKRDLSAVIEDKNRKISAQKAQATKYRNENQVLRDKIAFLESQLAQRNEK